MKRTVSIILSLTSVLAFCMAGCQQGNSTSSDVSSEVSKENVEQTSKYANAENWAYLETDVADTKADVFFVPPTSYRMTDNSSDYNMPLTDAETKKTIKLNSTAQKSIYADGCRFFAPYYSQIALNVYIMDQKITQRQLGVAFEDVKEAFEYYMKNYNNGRPIILAGFSQGSDMCIRLLEECFTSEARQKQLVACYAIGWRITEAEMKLYPHLKFATGESDTGCIISFNSESEDAKNSVMVPAGIKTLAINPLNWKTDSTPADKSLNIASAFMDYSTGAIKTETQFTGAYLDETRGTLKVTDVPKDHDIFKNSLNIMGEGVYHEYDCQFFAGNLKKNVQVRLGAYLAANAQ